MSWRASGDVAVRKMMDSNASQSLAQPGMFLRSSLISSLHTGERRTFSCDFIKWWSEGDSNPPGGGP